MPFATTAAAASGQADAKQYDSQKCDNDSRDSNESDDWNNIFIVDAFAHTSSILRIDVDHTRGFVTDAGARQ
jgi:hypothetical protein